MLRSSIRKTEAAPWRAEVPRGGCRRLADRVLAHVRSSGGPTGPAQPVFRRPRSSPPLCFYSSLTRSNRRGTDPYARWCGRGGAARCPPIPILAGKQTSAGPSPLSVRRRWQLPQLLLQPIEVDRLGEKLGSAEVAGAASALVVAIRRHHHDREGGEPLFDFAQQRQPVHPRHVDVGQNDNQFRLDFARKSLKYLIPRCREVHHIGA